MIVLDTTVLVYAVGSDHPLREPCRSLVAAIAAEQIRATTSVEVIQEFTHVRARRRGRGEAASVGRDYAELLTPLLTVSEAGLAAGLTLFEASQTLSAFDAVLAAASRLAGAQTLVSANRAFATVAGLLHVVPDGAGVAGLLER